MGAFRGISSLYIADGHHRAASAARARNELRHRAGSTGDDAGASTFIAVAFPDNQMQILPYNRTVKDLAGRTPRQFVASLREQFSVTDGTPTPKGPGEVSMYLDGRRDFGHPAPSLRRAGALSAASSELVRGGALLQDLLQTPTSR